MAREQPGGDRAKRAAWCCAARAAAAAPRPCRSTDALGRVLAEDIVAERRRVPAFDGSAMDGFAVRAQDIAGRRPIPGAPARSSASRAPGTRRRADARARARRSRSRRARTMPRGADAVVRVEDTARRGATGGASRLRSVRCRGRARTCAAPARTCAPASDRARRGRRARAGGARRARLGGARTRSACARRPRVAVLDDRRRAARARRADAPGRRAQLATRYTIPALARLRGRGGARTSSGVPDDPAATRAAIADGARERRRRGHLRRRVGGRARSRQAGPRRTGRAGALLAASRCEPGGPRGSAPRGTALGVRAARQPGLGDGDVHPARSHPRCARCWARGDPQRRRTRPCSTRDYEKRAGRAHAVRCRCERREDGWHAEPTGPQGSHILTSMLGADALAIDAERRRRVRAGERVEIELLRAPGWRCHEGGVGRHRARAPVRHPARARRQRIEWSCACAAARPSPTPSRALAERPRSASCSAGCRCRWPSTASTPSRETVLDAGDELALIPPVSGGAPARARTCASARSRCRSSALARRRRRRRRRRDRDLPGRHPRGGAARVRGLLRDGRGANRARSAECVEGARPAGAAAEHRVGERRRSGSRA